MSQKPVVSASAILQDIRDGLKDDELLEKYQLSEADLAYVFAALVKSGKLTRTEIAGRKDGIYPTPGSGTPPIHPPVPPADASGAVAGPPGLTPPGGPAVPPPATGGLPIPPPPHQPTGLGTAPPPGYPPGQPPYGPPRGWGPPPPIDPALEQYKRKAMIGLIVGLVLQLIGNILFTVGAVHNNDALAFAGGGLPMLVGFGLYMWGCFCLAKRKGYHGAMSLLGLVPCGFGICFAGWVILLLIPDKTKAPVAAPGGGASAAIIALGVIGVGVVLVALIGIILAIAIPYYVAHKRTACDRAASADLAKLQVALERLQNERLDMNCLAEDLRPEQVQYLVGPYYGWRGTTTKCDVRVRIADNELQACAMKGSHPSGSASRYLFRAPLSAAGDLPATVGRSCIGQAYGGPGATCYTESMLKTDCTIRKPSGKPCAQEDGLP